MLTELFIRRKQQPEQNEEIERRKSLNTEQDQEDDRG
jgi:hypothetical protein